MSKLVIVESPAKCKKIESYLGPGYVVMATYGHLRELPDLEAINVAAGYKPTFKECDNPLKKKQIYRLREAIRAADEVILATDDDNEGEAISWHVCDLFRLPVATTKRIVFHEITRPALTAAINNPGRLNMNRVAAQQCRQILDLLVGFKISPTLWSHLASNRENPLSAGRCQTPALRLIFDNDLTIRDYAAEATTTTTPTTYKVTGYFTPMLLKFELEPGQIEGGEPIENFLTQSIKHNNFFVANSEIKRSIRAAPRPLITSSLQQCANNEFHIGVKDTMRIAQSLYEKGAITYMRTDSAKYSQQFIDGVVAFVGAKWGAAYVSDNCAALSLGTGSGTGATVAPAKQPKKKSGAATNVPPTSVQAAHEAIRPTDIAMTPHDFNKKTDQIMERKLYKMIWEHSLKSLMAPAQYDVYTAHISSALYGGNPEHLDQTFQRKCEKVVFKGWQVVQWNASIDQEIPAEWDYLRALRPNSPMAYKKMDATPLLKTGPQHYNEAHLVKMLEEMGIGRPSTFSMLVNKIQEREYVKVENIEPIKVECVDYNLSAGDAVFSKMNLTRSVGGERQKLLLQPIGRIVSDFLQRHFSSILNYEYTRSMEAALDEIANGYNDIATVCGQCDAQLAACLALIEKGKMTYKFDKTHSLVIGRDGPVICHKGTPTYYIPLYDRWLNVFDNALFERICKGELVLQDLCNISGATSGATPDQTTGVVGGGGHDVAMRAMGQYNDLNVYLKTGKFGHYISLETVTKVETAAETVEEASVVPVAPAPAKRGRKKKVEGGEATVPVAPPARKKKQAQAESIVMKTISLKPFGEHRSLNSFTWEEIVDLIEGKGPKNPNILRELSETISIRKGKPPKGAPYIYFKNEEMKSPMFYKLKGFLHDPLECPVETLKDWIKEKHNIF